MEDSTTDTPNVAVFMAFLKSGDVTAPSTIAWASSGEFDPPFIITVKVTAHLKVVTVSGGVETGLGTREGLLVGGTVGRGDGWSEG